MKALQVSYDEESDVLTVDGVKFSGALMRGFAKPGSYLRIESRTDGTLTMRGFSPQLEAEFNKVAGLKAP